ncbi:MAG: hypothetical protein K0S25_4 [Bacillus sp. (in: firmicutes)]|nr:hypothetical protein [Bacillus sp. (in: firmicutes)]
MDWEFVKEISFGALNLSHDTFWRLTPSEFLDLYDGWQWREDRRLEEIKASHELRIREFSVLASWLTAPHVKKPPKPTDFYDPERRPENRRKTTPEESKRMIDQLEKQMGVK